MDDFALCDLLYYCHDQVCPIENMFCVEFRQDPDHCPSWELECSQTDVVLLLIQVAAKTDMIEV